MFRTHFPRTLSSRAHLFASCFLLLALAACSSSPKANARWLKAPNYASNAIRGTTIYVSCFDATSSPEFEFVEDELRQAAHKRGLTLTDDPATASFVYYVALRFFDVNGKLDQGQMLIEKAGEVPGGQIGWEIEGQGASVETTPVEAVQLEPASSNFFKGMFRSSEWDVLIDFAIGERKPESVADYIRREGRLLGTVISGSLTREEAAQALEPRIRSALANVLPRSGARAPGGAP